MIETLLGNVIAGVFASIVTLVALQLYKTLSYRHKYARFEGRYSHRSIGGDPLNEGVTTIKYLRKNILETRGKDTDGRWQGRIMMSDGVPGYGTGVYQYEGKSDCGRHEIQVSLDGQTIFV
jgi:hypothetical protein